MSFITRCPACSTMFKVVPDQLRVSDGWVRCGQCDEVFDANINLQADGSAFDEVQHEADALLDGLDGDAASLNAPYEDAPIPAIDFDVAVKATSAPVHELENPPHQAKTHAAPVRRSEPFLDPEPQSSKAAQPTPLLAADLVATTAIPNDWTDKATDGGLPRFPASSLSDLSSGELAEPSAYAAQPTFMQVEQARSRWHHVVVRIALSLVALALAAALLGQIALQERAKLAAHAPGLRPMLQILCDALSCQLGLPRDIESVFIESSSFVKVKADVYKLNVSLKNASKIVLAMPSLELTLTDGQDQPIVRKVIDASAIDLQKTGALTTSLEVSATVPVSVKLPAGSERVSGYRLLAFYP